MDLHLSLPDGFAARGTDWFVARPAASLVESSDGDGDDGGSGTASTIVGLLPLLLIVVAVYFLLLRPRQRQMRQQRELQSSLEVGDEVMLTSGVYGFITGFERAATSSGWRSTTTSRSGSAGPPYPARSTRGGGAVDGRRGGERPPSRQPRRRGARR